MGEHKKPSLAAERAAEKEAQREQELQRAIMQKRNSLAEGMLLAMCHSGTAADIFVEVAFAAADKVIAKEFGYKITITQE